jgi:hypothetical protein
MANWMALLAGAVVADPRGIAGVAERIGFSRPAISQVLSGTYAASTARIETAVMDHYDLPLCPLAGGVEIPRATCRRKALRPQPFGGRVILADWHTCQACQYKPNK